MKAILYSSSGEKKSEIELPSIFLVKIRDDIVAKYLESEKLLLRQKYSTYEEAGKRHSASGTISHRRHEWKGHYGKGIARLPRKTMYRRGTQFFWIGAEVSQTRGGRVAHPPQGIYRYRKINKKEKELALHSAIASTANKDYLLKRYSTLKDVKVVAPVIESLPNKTKDLLKSLKNIFGNSLELILRNKKVRAGKGKKRGRKYKSNAGLLIIKGKDEKAVFSGLDVKSFDSLNIRDLYPLGRLTLYTSKAMEELGK